MMADGAPNPEAITRPWDTATQALGSYGRMLYYGEGGYGGDA
jgi:hypothetical protein